MSETNDAVTSPVERIVMLPLPDGSTRMESGVLQFGDDWPGVFLRGDEALCLSFMLEQAADAVAANGDIISMNMLRSAAKALSKCKTT